MQHLGLVVLTLILISSECKDKMDCRTTLVNNSSEKLWFDFACFEMPDSLLWLGNCIEKIVSPYDTAKMYSMTDILEDQKYYRKDVYSPQELEAMNWTITYP